MLLDTTVLIDALRGRAAAHRLRAMRTAGAIPSVCVISVEEVWRGLRPAEETAALLLVEGLRLVPLGRTEGVIAGRWRREHAARGVTLHQADCLVAAAALAAGGTLATGNPRDFPMPEVTVEHWPVGV